MNKILRSRKGQGTTEYIVILAIAVGLAVTIFWGNIKGKLDTKVQQIATDISKPTN